MVKILRQLADLISGLHLCPHFQISARNAAGGSGQPSQRPEQPDRDQITAKPLQKQKPRHPPPVNSILGLSISKKRRHITVCLQVKQRSVFHQNRAHRRQAEALSGPDHHPCSRLAGSSRKKSLPLAVPQDLLRPAVVKLPSFLIVKLKTKFCSTHSLLHGLGGAPHIRLGKSGRPVLNRRGPVSGKGILQHPVFIRRALHLSLKTGLKQG